MSIWSKGKRIMAELINVGKAASPKPINGALQAISRRAERLDPQQQAKTFVSLGGIERTLLNPDNRIIFGRRGSGKTHVLAFITGSARQKGDISISLDLRTIGSNSYIYIDESISIQERATRLLRDFVLALHDHLEDVVTAPRATFNIQKLGPLIGRLGASITEVIVRDEVETRIRDKTGSESKRSGEISGRVRITDISADAKVAGEQNKSGEQEVEIKESGHFRISINLGDISRVLADIVEVMGTRIWISVDEWSSVPESLQPYLADFLKRVIFPHRNYSVCIAAIEQRASFRLGTGAETIGIELGSDAFADVNLDDHLVFEYDPPRSMNFFGELLRRHLSALEEKVEFDTVESFIKTAFTQEQTFRELVRACEGVPRDIINIVQMAANRAQDEKISIPHIRAAAKDWYERDKSTFVNSNAEASDLLHWIVHQVIGERKAKAFLVRNDVKNDIMERLFDERVLHIAKKSYSTKEEPGVRYRVWKIDYGCYVDLINTARAPTGFLFEDQDIVEEGSIAVPEDDLRAIRRAVLDIGEFDKRAERAM